MRLPKTDHDRWARDHDLAAFGRDATHAYYTSLERTSGTGGDGRDGPFPVHQLGEEDVSDQHRAFIASAREAHVPLGGVRDSGWGRTGPDCMNDFSDTIWINARHSANPPHYAF